MSLMGWIVLALIVAFMAFAAWILYEFYLEIKEDEREARYKREPYGK